MTFDALAMHAVVDEMRPTIEGGRVDSVFLVEDRRLAIEVYGGGRRSTLILSADPRDARFYVTGDRTHRGTDRVTPFLLLLRKYVRGSRIVALHQPRLERLLTIALRTHPNDDLPREVALVAEVMGRRSNLVLVDEDGSIMDALVRVPPSVNPSRPLLPHLRYTPPPAETKPDPDDPNLGGRLRMAAGDAASSAWRVVVDNVAGFSPLAAKEALARCDVHPAALAADVTNWDEVGDALSELAHSVRSGSWEPSIAWEGGSALAYAPYQLRQITGAEVRTYASMSEVVALAGGPAVRPPRFDRLKRPMQDALGARLDQSRRKRSSLERSLASADRADELRSAGEAILTNVSVIPADAASFEWEGRRIDLYPSLTAVENAQSYFRQYADARDAGKVVPPLLNEVEAELQYLDEMMLHVDLAEDERSLNALRRELEEAGHMKAARPKRNQSKATTAKRPGGPYRRLSIDGAEILVGSSAEGNATVTFRLAEPNDLWFHVRGAPGAHVLLRASGSTAPAAIETAAQLAAANSARRGDARVEVDYTLRKHVRKISGGAPGRVTFVHETTVRVEPIARGDAGAMRGSQVLTA
ncbi:MAG: Fibronectin-binding domain protein [Chloroflexi bacterium]|nr:Fibronectin-binding domain protein [Chloroflexota bacterium]